MVHSMARLVIRERVEFATEDDTTLILCQSGELRIMAAGQTGRLGPFDACLIEQSGVDIRLEAETTAVAMMVELTEVMPTR